MAAIVIIGITERKIFGSKNEICDVFRPGLLPCTVQKQEEHSNYVKCAQTTLKAFYSKSHNEKPRFIE